MRKDVHRLRERTARASPSTPVLAVVDTSELRWFADGHVPEDVVGWFTADHTSGAFEERSDSYRDDRRADVGVKRRFGHRLELKRRRAVGATVALMPRLVGRLEEWRRWSPADGLVEPLERESWIEVRKAVVKRRFSRRGDELRVSPALPAMGGCDVELAAITVGSLETWSFALSAFGPLGHRPAALRTAWVALSAEDGCPAELETMFDSCCGYPQWLADLCDRESVGNLADPGLQAAG